MVALKPDRAAAAWSRALAAVLALLGLPAALVAWIAVLGGPAEAVEDLFVALRLHDPARIRAALIQAPLLVGFSMQLAWGYWIWGGWLDLVIGRQASTRRFWLLAALQHLIWVMFILAHRHPTSPGNLLVGVYSVVVGLACLGAGLACRPPLDRPKPAHGDWTAIA